MAKRNSKDSSVGGTKVRFKIHPRAFKALGADLVTNDVVAIFELVKNAYDAYATKVEIRFREGANTHHLEIEDNGFGMDRDVIENAWCTVATTYRRDNPIARRPGRRNRRASRLGPPRPDDFFLALRSADLPPSSACAGVLRSDGFKPVRGLSVAD